MPETDWTMFLSIQPETELPGRMKLATEDTPPAAALATSITVSLAMAASVRRLGGGFRNASIWLGWPAGA